MYRSSGDVVRRLLQCGAAEVDLGELYERSDLVWGFNPGQEISYTCVELELLLSAAARNSKDALQAIEDRAHYSLNLRDKHLLTALKKYVQDACEAIKRVDSRLRKEKSSLGHLLYEVPSETKHDEMSWRNLIGRRDVIAHNLLTIDNERVYQEAARDFDALHCLLFRTYFVPIKTHFEAGKGLPTTCVRTEIVRKLTPTRVGGTPGIGESLILICEDKKAGFLALRLGRSEENTLVFSATKALHRVRISVHPIAGVGE